MIRKYEVFESNSAITLLKITENFQKKALQSNTNFKLKHFIFKKNDAILLQPNVILNVIVSKRHVLIERNSELKEYFDYLDKKFTHIGSLLLQDPDEDLDSFLISLESEIKSLKKQMSLEFC